MLLTAVGDALLCVQPELIPAIAQSRLHGRLNGVKGTILKEMPLEHFEEAASNQEETQSVECPAEAEASPNRPRAGPKCWLRPPDMRRVEATVMRFTVRGLTRSSWNLKCAAVTEWLHNVFVPSNADL